MLIITIIADFEVLSLLPCANHFEKNAFSFGTPFSFLHANLSLEAERSPMFSNRYTAI